MLPTNLTKGIAIAIGISAIVGCTNSDLAYKLQGDGPTSLELYRGTTGEEEQGEYTEELREELIEVTRYDGYTRDAGNEIDQLFHRLPNPRLLVFVYPHLATSDNAPIPGYTTAINLYEKDEYALPHEVVAYSPNAPRAGK